jgi:hypothetical protein
MSLTGYLSFTYVSMLQCVDAAVYLKHNIYL